jgi:hypothetical protein
MARRRYEFEPLRIECDVGDDGRALLKFQTERADIVLELSSDVFLRLLDRTKRAQAEKEKHVAKQSVVSAQVRKSARKKD